MLCAVTDYSTMEFVEYEDVFNYLQGGAEASEGAKRSIRRKSKKPTLMVARERQWIKDEEENHSCLSFRQASWAFREREKISNYYTQLYV